MHLRSELRDEAIAKASYKIYVPTSSNESSLADSSFNFCSSNKSRGEAVSTRTSLPPKGDERRLEDPKKRKPIHTMMNCAGSSILEEPRITSLFNFVVSL
uniref:Uncharacterized protein n=1 Tax=Opuntia streptacantha TaxID=393608 RepID=A0A7C8YVS4_OPUST